MAGQQGWRGLFLCVSKNGKHILAVKPFHGKDDEQSLQSCDSQIFSDKLDRYATAMMLAQEMS